MAPYSINQTSLQSLANPPQKLSTSFETKSRQTRNPSTIILEKEHMAILTSLILNTDFSTRLTQVNSSSWMAQLLTWTQTCKYRTPRKCVSFAKWLDLSKTSSNRLFPQLGSLILWISKIAWQIISTPSWLTSSWIYKNTMENWCHTNSSSASKFSRRQLIILKKWSRPSFLPSNNSSSFLTSPEPCTRRTNKSKPPKWSFMWQASLSYKFTNGTACQLYRKCG